MSHCIPADSRYINQQSFKVKHDADKRETDPLETIDFSVQTGGVWLFHQLFPLK